MMLNRLSAPYSDIPTVSIIRLNILCWYIVSLVVKYGFSNTHLLWIPWFATRPPMFIVPRVNTVHTLNLLLSLISRLWVISNIIYALISVMNIPCIRYLEVSLLRRNQKGLPYLACNVKTRYRMYFVNSWYESSFIFLSYRSALKIMSHSTAICRKSTVSFRYSINQVCSWWSCNDVMFSYLQVCNTCFHA